MGSSVGATGLVARPRSVESSRGGEARVCLDPDPLQEVLDRHQRECDGLAHRMHERHRGVALADIRALIEQASDDLADARVQSFKLILVERAVRRRLDSAA